MKPHSVILFFGSFNPIHNGHLTIADTVLGITGDSELWFVVSPQNPFKDKTELADEADRMKMVELGIEYAGKEQGKKHASRMKACDIETKMPKPSWTANTLRELTSLFPGYVFKILIGSDNVDSFGNWKDSDYILGNYDILVYPRECFEPAKRELVKKMQTLSNVPLLPYAATNIRNIIARGEDVYSELPPPVWKYIKDNGLYGFENKAPEENISEKIAALSKKIEMSPQDYTLYMERGKLYQKCGAFREAQNDFTRVTELDPGNMEAKSYISILQEIFDFRYLDLYNP